VSSSSCLTACTVNAMTIHSLQLTFGGVLPNINDEEGEEDNGGGADVVDEVVVVV
jgi:hypothetical protein